MYREYVISEKGNALQQISSALSANFQQFTAAAGAMLSLYQMQKFSREKKWTGRELFPLVILLKCNCALNNVMYKKHASPFPNTNWCL